MARAASLKRDLSFEEAWTLLQEEAINKLIDNLEGVQKHELSSEEYMRFYTYLFNFPWILAKIPPPQ